MSESKPISKKNGNGNLHSTELENVGCGCSNHMEPMPVDEEIRWKPSSSSIEYPAVPFPASF